MRRRGATNPIVQPARRGAPLLAEQEQALRQMRQKVQIARKQLGLADDDYRAVLERVTGQRSSTACNAHQLDAVLAEFRRLGWKAVKGKVERPRSAKLQVRMIHAVWADLRPFVAEHTHDALRAFVRRQTKTPATPDGVDAPEFLDSEQATKVLEGLKAWLGREQTKLRLAARR